MRFPKLNLVYFLSFLFIFSLSLNSCKSSTDDKIELSRKEKLSEKQMIEILSEMHILEENVQKVYLNRMNREKLALHYYNQLFEKYGTNKALFEKNLLYYQNDYDRFEIIYTKVIDNLSQRQKLPDKIIEQKIK